MIRESQSSHPLNLHHQVNPTLYTSVHPIAKFSMPVRMHPTKAPQIKRIQASRHAHCAPAHTPVADRRPPPAPIPAPISRCTHSVDFSRFPDPYSVPLPSISPPDGPSAVVSKMPVPCGPEVVEPKVLASLPEAAGSVVSKMLCPVASGNPHLILHCLICILLLHLVHQQLILRPSSWAWWVSRGRAQVRTSGDRKVMSLCRVPDLGILI